MKKNVHHSHSLANGAKVGGAIVKIPVAAASQGEVATVPDNLLELEINPSAKNRLKNIHVENTVIFHISSVFLSLKTCSVKKVRIFYKLYNKLWLFQITRLYYVCAHQFRY